MVKIFVHSLNGIPYSIYLEPIAGHKDGRIVKGSFR